MSPPELYDIIRFRMDGVKTIVRMNLTLEEAQAHCRDDSTHGDGWFDGYAESGSYPSARIELDE